MISYLISELAVGLYHFGMQLSNNSFLLASMVGVNEAAVVCITERRPCCKKRPAQYGEWYYPNNSMVPPMGRRWLFYRSRADNGTITLHRVNDNEVTGKFCCHVPDQHCDGLNHTLCVELGNVHDSQMIIILIIIVNIFTSFSGINYCFWSKHCW